MKGHRYTVEFRIYSPSLDPAQITGELTDGLTSLLNELWALRETILTYGKGGSLLWWCGNIQSSFNGGPTFSPELMKRLGEFGAELYIDNYFSPLEKESAECA